MCTSGELFGLKSCESGELCKRESCKSGELHGHESYKSGEQMNISRVNRGVYGRQCKPG